MPRSRAHPHWRTRGAAAIEPFPSYGVRKFTVSGSGRRIGVSNSGPPASGSRITAPSEAKNAAICAWASSVTAAALAGLGGPVAAIDELLERHRAGHAVDPRRLVAQRQVLEDLLARRRAARVVDQAAQGRGRREQRVAEERAQPDDLDRRAARHVGYA